MIETLRQAKGAEQLFRALVRRRRVAASDQLRKDHIFDSVELGKQVVELIDEAEKVAPEPRAALGRQ